MVTFQHLELLLLHPSILTARPWEMDHPKRTAFLKNHHFSGAIWILGEVSLFSCLFVPLPHPKTDWWHSSEVCYFKHETWQPENLTYRYLQHMIILGYPFVKFQGNLNPHLWQSRGRCLDNFAMALRWAKGADCLRQAFCWHKSTLWDCKWPWTCWNVFFKYELWKITWYKCDLLCIFVGYKYKYVNMNQPVNLGSLFVRGNLDYPSSFLAGGAVITIQNPSTISREIHMHGNLFDIALSFNTCLFKGVCKCTTPCMTSKLKPNQFQNGISWYCWWQKSCTTWNIYKPCKGIFTISTGDRRISEPLTVSLYHDRPSNTHCGSVSPSPNHQQLAHSPWDDLFRQTLLDAAGSSWRLLRPQGAENSSRGLKIL